MEAISDETDNEQKSVILTIGASKTIKVKNAPAKAKLTYKASPKSVVRVSKKGKVTGLNGKSGQIR